MKFVEWENKKILKIEILDFGYMSDMFNNSITINIVPNEFNNKITNYINFWSDKQTKEDLIIYFNVEKKGARYFLLKNGLPIRIIINSNGHLQTCTFKFNSIKEISRSLKIKQIIDSLEK